MTPELLSRAAGITPALATQWAAPLTAAWARFGISSPLRQAQFLAQVGHESAGFTALVENLNYSAEGLARTWPGRFSSGTGPNELAREIARKPELIANAAYGLRMGNNAQGDGWKYRGRGLLQLTGRDNYAKAGAALGLPLVADPDSVATREVAALTAAWFWATNGLNALADAVPEKPVGLAQIDQVRRAVSAVTRRINGGLNGLADRLERYDRARRALGV